MTSTVRVVRPIALDEVMLASLLGEPPVSVEHVTSPSILVNGRFHEAASRWLRRKYLLRPIESTVNSHASRLARYIAYLRNARGLNHPSERHADLFAATDDDVRAFYRALQFDQDTAVSSATWRAQLSTLKQIHEFLREAYGVPLPFRLVTFTNPVGVKATTAIELRARTRQGSSGVPVTPGYAELLVQGALRIDRDGHQTLSRSVDRDAALVNFGLATGLRHETLATITTYEIPALTDRPFTSIRVPDFITKGDAGGEALVFAHRLHAVHDYISGGRAELIEHGAPFRPVNPIRIVVADSDCWTTEIGGKRKTFRWAETDAAIRRRLVNPDGSTPIVWLNSYRPTPLSYDHVGSITTDARNWTRANVHEEFPARFRTHDLRHTYATHLTVCIFKQAVSPHVHPDVADAFVPARLSDAVEIAKLSLGHASESSTKLYVQHAHNFLHVPLDEFLGGH